MFKKLEPYIKVTSKYIRGVTQNKMQQELWPWRIDRYVPMSMYSKWQSNIFYIIEVIGLWKKAFVSTILICKTT